MQKHLRLISRKPQVAQSSLELKTDFVIAVWDRLLLADLQSDWKVVPSEGGGDTGDTGTDDDITI